MSRPTTPPGHLTPAEALVLNEIAKGGTNRQVGRRLGITQRAVVMRMERARKRIGATNTTHLLALAIATRQIAPGVATGTAVEK